MSDVLESGWPYALSCNIVAKKKTGRVGRQIRRAVGIVSRMIDTGTQSLKDVLLDGDVCLIVETFGHRDRMPIPKITSK